MTGRGLVSTLRHSRVSCRQGGRPCRQAAHSTGPASDRARRFEGAKGRQWERLRRAPQRGWWFRLACGRILWIELAKSQPRIRTQSMRLDDRRGFSSDVYNAQRKWPRLIHITHREKSSLSTLESMESGIVAQCQRRKRRETKRDG